MKVRLHDRLPCDKDRLLIEAEVIPQQSVQHQRTSEYVLAYSTPSLWQNSKAECDCVCTYRDCIGLHIRIELDLCISLAKPLSPGFTAFAKIPR